MVMNSRGQFFLLAAVIISVVVLSLGVTTNRAIVSEGSDSFYDYSYEVQREVGAVMDYDIYTDFDESAKLDDFVDLLSEDIKEKNPYSDFVLVYGEGVNFSKKEYNKNGTLKNAKTKICIKNENVCKEIPNKISKSKEFKDVSKNVDKDKIVVEFDNRTYEFPVSDNKQVIFIMKKDVGDEKFVTIG